MNNKRNPAFLALGIIMIVVGTITFIVSAVNLYNVQTTKSRWIEGFMQDYQARTNAENSIPCYIFMALAVVMIVAGIIMLAIKPKKTSSIQNRNFNRIENNYTGKVNEKCVFCSGCGSKLDNDAIYCGNCGKKVIKLD